MRKKRGKELQRRVGRRWGKRGRESDKGGNGGGNDRARGNKEERRRREEGDVGRKVWRRGRIERTEREGERDIIKKKIKEEEKEDQKDVEWTRVHERAIENVRAREREREIGETLSLELSRRLCRCAWQSFASGSPWPNHFVSLSAQVTTSRGTIWCLNYFLRTISYNGTIIAKFREFFFFFFRKSDYKRTIGMQRLKSIESPRASC